MKKQIASKKVASAPKILSQGIESGGFVFLSGQIGSDTDWKIALGGIGAETKQALENIKILLEETGLGMDDIVKVTIYVTDISLAPEINEIYSTYFNEPLPAREMVGVKELPLGAMIEISVVASR